MVIFLKDDVLSRHKIFAHKKRLEDWLDSGIGLPITAEIDSTNKCNFNCYGCAGGRNPKGAFLSNDDFNRVFEQLNFVKAMVFTGGGEPLLNKGTAYAINLAKNKSIDVGLITNGSLISNNYSSNIVEIILDSVSWVRVSLDAIDSSQYSFRKGVKKELFDLTLNNISNLVKQKNKRNSSATIGLAYLTINESLNDLLSFVNLSKRLGVDYAEFRPYHGLSRDMTDKLNKLKQFETDNFKIYYPLNRYKKIKFDFPQSFADEFRIVVSANGDLYSDCFTRGNHNFVYGNILHQSFDEIWNSEKKKELFANKLHLPGIPTETFFDELSNLLWNVKQFPEKYDLDSLEKKYSSFSHKNFV